MQIVIAFLACMSVRSVGKTNETKNVVVRCVYTLPTYITTTNKQNKKNESI